MKQTFLFIAVVSLLAGCHSKTAKQEQRAADDQQTTGSDISSRQANEETDALERQADEVPPNGTYRFDIAFAEYQGKSLGEQVTVVIHNDSIKVIYEGDGDLDLKKGAIIEEGIIIKHQSGDWIIGHDPDDREAEPIGGCSGGPSVIDFKDKKFWMC